MADGEDSSVETLQASMLYEARDRRLVGSTLL
jgi:hypothetical protein